MFTMLRFKSLKHRVEKILGDRFFCPMLLGPLKHRVEKIHIVLFHIVVSDVSRLGNDVSAVPLLWERDLAFFLILSFFLE